MKRKTFALALIVTLLFSMVAVINFLRLATGNPSTRDIAKVPDPLIVEIKSPYNKTYNTNLIQLNLTAQIPGPYTCEYSVDKGPFINVPLTKRNPVFGGTIDTSILLNLSDGIHTIVARAEYAVACVSFTIDTVPPYLSIMMPENLTHNKSTILLEYLVAGYPKVSYSLDGKDNVSITENSTLRGIIDGVHQLILYGKTSDGSVVASEPVFFGINSGKPKITILSIENNATYYTYALDLTFNLSEPSPEIFYGHSRQSKTYISGNVTLVNLPSGYYKLFLHARDSITDDYSNVEVAFYIENPFPTEWLLAFAVVTVFAFGLSLLLYLIKRK